MQPASRHCSRSPCMAWAVRATIGVRQPACAELPRGAVAVQDRHLHVHQDAVERLAGVAGLAELFDGDLAVLGHVDRQRRACCSSKAISRWLSGPSSASSTRPERRMSGRRRRREGFFCGVAWPRGARRTCGRPPAGRFSTVSRNELPFPGALSPVMSPPSMSRQPFADGQAEARAAEPPRRRAVGLRERLEDRGHLLRRHSHARVDHLEADAGIGAVGRVVMSHHEPHAAALGELDGVAQQVDQDLAEPRRIGVDRLGNRPAVLDLQREAAWRRRGPASRRPLRSTSCAGEQSIRSTVILPASIFEMSRMSLMMPSRWLPLRGWCATNSSRSLPSRSSCSEQVGVAEDGGHGRADFVAHVGQEFALGAVGRFGGLLGHLEFGGALHDAVFQFVAGLPQGVSALLDLIEHGVEAVVEHAQLVVAELLHADRIVVVAGDPPHGLDQPQDRRW